MAWPRTRRLLLGFGSTLLLVLVVVAIAGTCYVTGEIAAGGLNPSFGPPTLDAEVVEVGDDRITLRRVNGDHWERHGAWGVVWPGGFGRIGEVISIDPAAETAVREWEPLGAAPDPGQLVDLVSVPYPPDPLAAHGLAFEEVSVTSELGELNGWLVPAEGSTWVVFTHGKGASRTESLNTLPTVHELGLPMLSISYRNDRDAPRSDDARYHYGETEWRDLEVWVQYALDAGASDIILMGTSMGGGITMSFLYESPLASSVRAVVLDAPMLHLRRTFGGELNEASVPGFIHGYLLAVAEWRYGVDIQAPNYLDRVDELDVPVLLFHGDADQTIRIGTSDDFAAARPDLVRYVRVEGVTHARVFQERPELALAELRAFLEAVLAP